MANPQLLWNFVVGKPYLKEARQHQKYLLHVSWCYSNQIRHCQQLTDALRIQIFLLFKFSDSFLYDLSELMCGNTVSSLTQQAWYSSWKRTKNYGELDFCDLHYFSINSWKEGWQREAFAASSLHFCPQIVISLFLTVPTVFDQPCYLMQCTLPVDPTAVVSNPSPIFWPLLDSIIFTLL